MSNRYGEVVHRRDVKEGECFAYEIDYRNNPYECLRFCTDKAFREYKSQYPRWRYTSTNSPGGRDKQVIIIAPPYAMRSDKFPHRCPNCNAPAYVGFTLVECSRNCNAAN